MGQITRVLLKSGESLMFGAPWPGIPEMRKALQERMEQTGQELVLPPEYTIGLIRYFPPAAVRTTVADDEEVETKTPGHYLLVAEDPNSPEPAVYLTMKVYDDCVILVDEQMTEAELLSLMDDDDGEDEGDVEERSAENDGGSPAEGDQ